MKKQSQFRYRQDLSPSRRKRFDTLPQPVKDALCAIAHDESEWQIMLAVHHERRSDAVTRLKEAERDLNQLQSDIGRGVTTPRDVVKQAEADAEAARAELAGMKDSPPRPVFTTEMAWEFLDSHAGVVWMHVPPVWTATPSIEGRAKLHAKLDAKKEERKRIDNSNLTLREGCAGIDAFVQGIARGGDMRPQAALRLLSGPRGKRQGRPTITHNQDGSVSPERLCAVMFNLFESEIADKLKVRLRESFEPANAYSIAERQSALAKIETELRSLEHADESNYLACRKAGLSVTRRENVRAEAVLQIAADPNRKAASVPEAGKTRGSLQIVQAGDKDEDAADFDFGDEDEDAADFDFG